MMATSSRSLKPLKNPEQDEAPEGPRSTFPTSVDDFKEDVRISFSKLKSKWILEAEDDEEYEYDLALKRWVQVVDDSLLEQQRQAYATDGVEETSSVEHKNKRKNPDDEPDKNTKRNKQGEVHARKNTAVYVTSIPLNAKIDEVQHVFSRCGVIAEEIDSGNPRIKLYYDDDGNFKGDALVVYFRAESVDLAIQMLDDSDFRLGEAGPSGPMRVQAADFSYKKEQDAPAKTNMKDKRKIIKKTQKLNNKLADWDDDDPANLHQTNSKWDKVVILKHMFTLKELEEDPGAADEIKEDINEECAKLGPVHSITLFDKEEDGVVSIKFNAVEAAIACVKLMNGRFFDTVKVEAYIADGSERFKKSPAKKVAGTGDEDENEDSKRLEKFAEMLEGNGNEGI